jgi:hypothetical protein
MQHIYSGFITKGQGFDGPVPFDGPAGWTVNKMQQTGIFKITHNLKLDQPHKLRVVVTPAKPFTTASVESITADSFTVSVWVPGGAEAHTDINFIAVKE